MFKQCLLPATLLCLVCLTGHAQYRPQDGYIIKKNGDTLFGKLRIEQGMQTPKNVHFISFDGDRREVLYFPRDLQGFEMPGFCAFLCKEVEIDDRPVDEGSTLLNISQQRTRKATVFLKKLVEGYRLNLYYYRDYKDHFFWQYSNSNDIMIRELDYGVGAKEESQELLFNNAFKKKLLDLAKEFQLHFMEKEILDATYEVGPLTSIVKRLNMLQSDILYDASKEGVLFPKPKGPYLMIAIGWTGLRHQSSSGPHLPYHIPGALPFVAAIGKRVGPALLRGKIAFKVEAMGYFSYYDVYTMDTIPTWGGEHLTDVNSAYIDLSLALQVCYTPWPGARFSPSLSTGLQGIFTWTSYPHYTSSKSQTLELSDALVRPLRLAPLVKITVPVIDNISISVGRIFHSNTLFTDGSWFRPLSTFVGLTLGDL
ncbi:hypothetical protein HB364_13680 [Pseudoflavitalea sp. X16]|uniref:hypothetical protein n=1 Tax=Paraflavitalea devenefica TaxID=2716334 RepID=UPI0014222540|nr:hypothetical protein [Paraflavitalea devenefica]NII26138.1 hypothetical protein [Paraflavitalea devenefica]